MTINQKCAPKNHEKENKPQMSLIPDDLLRDFLEPAYREGLIKYSRESWREGFPITVMMDALKRHMTQFFYDGEHFDKDASKLGIKKHHLGGAMFAILCMCDTIKNHPEMDDRPKKITLDSVQKKLDERSFRYFDRFLSSMFKIKGDDR